MNYNFNYDPNSGETPWPMIWTVSPTQYNWEGTVGDTISFSVEAIPDPDYPTAWNENFTIETTDPSGNVTTTTPPPLPPEPVLQEYIYSESSSLDQEFVSVSFEDGLVLDEVNSELFFEYENITYFKDDIKKTARFPQDVIDDSFDYISSFLPSGEEFLIKNSVVTVLSTSSNDLVGDFKFKINNDWDQARILLSTLTDQAKSFFAGLVSGSSPGTPNAPQINEPSTGELSNNLPPSSDSFTPLDDIKGEQTYDEFFRTTSDEDINTTITENPSFIDDLQSDAAPDAIDSESSEFGSEELPIDETMREGNLEEIKNKTGLSDEDIINRIRGIS